MYPLFLFKWPFAIHHSNTWQKWRKMSLWRFNYCSWGGGGVSLWQPGIEWAICRTNWCLKSLQDLIGLKEEPGNGCSSYQSNAAPGAAAAAGTAAVQDKTLTQEPRPAPEPELEPRQGTRSLRSCCVWNADVCEMELKGLRVQMPLGNQWVLAESQVSAHCLRWNQVQRSFEWPGVKNQANRWETDPLGCCVRAFDQ